IRMAPATNIFTYLTTQNPLQTTPNCFLAKPSLSNIIHYGIKIMNYRHIYHAGNFADVVKHVVLMMLLQSISRKDIPFCYIDTHAGPGCYDLMAEFANKTKEYENGIEKIIAQENPPPIIKRYLDTVHVINNELTHSKFASLRYYPGSPLLAKRWLRATDHIVA